MPRVRGGDHGPIFLQRTSPGHPGGFWTNIDGSTITVSLYPDQLRSSAIEKSNDDHSQFEGLKVLVVEDNYLVAILFVDALEELGCKVIGPCPSVSSALAAVDEEDFDVALVDFHLHGETAAPVAERLSVIGRPFAIASGGGTEIEGQGQLTCLHKPFMVSDVAQVLRDLVSQSGK